MDPAGDSESRVPAAIERFVRQLVIANKAVALYPPSSTIPRDTSSEAVAILDEALRKNPEVRLVVGHGTLLYEGVPVFPGHSAFENFAREFSDRGLADVRFHAGTEPSDLIALLTVLNCPIDEVAASGGFEFRLWGQNVGTISVTQTETIAVDSAIIDTAEEPDMDSLLDRLAEEPDATARRGLVDAISKIAPGHIQELGRHVGDERWYFARNVVAILGSARTPEALPFFERTLNHIEPRVRRETIRALSMIRDGQADRLLVDGLYDEDAQNVQLAARYVGQNGISEAIPMLDQVARGEGRGNRDTGPRVEAIEALGRLGAVGAEWTLEMLAAKRGPFRGREARKMRAAAVAALERAKTRRESEPT